MRGCQYQFMVKVMNGKPDVAYISYKEMFHIDKNGQFFHGIHDTSGDKCSMFAANLSTKCKSYIESLLLMDISVNAIIDRHINDPVLCGMMSKRDQFLTRKDVMNV